MEERLETVGTNVTEIKQMLEKHIDGDKELDRKYASKWVETSVLWFGGVIVLGVLAGIFKIILI